MSDQARQPGTLGGRSFQEELATYTAHRDRWIREGRENEWVAIHADSIVGIWPSMDEAYYGAASKFDEGDFLVKRIGPDEEPVVIRRAFWGRRGSRSAR